MEYLRNPEPASTTHSATKADAHGWTSMFFLIAFLIFFFYVPLYRTALSKGYPYREILGTTIVYQTVVYLGLSVAASMGITHWWLWLTWLPISLVLIILQLLPARPGAPGLAAFTVSMTCPECIENIEFDRDRVGLVDSCKECGEIFTVIDEAESPVAGPGVEALMPQTEFASSDDDTRREMDNFESSSDDAAEKDNWVLFCGYDSIHAADLDRGLLDSEGITTLLQTSAPGGTIFGTMTLGWQLLVPESEIRQAEDLLEEPDPGS